MTRKQWWKSTGATIAATSLLAGQALAAATPDVVLGAASSPAMKYAISPAAEPLLSHAAKQALIKANIKYVFVIFQENRSYDHFFGTFPVADGLFNQPSSQILGFSQPIVRASATGAPVISTVSPFLIPQTVTNTAGAVVPLYPADTSSVDHSHSGYIDSLHVNPKTLLAANDRYALDEEGLTTNASGQIIAKSTGLPPTAGPSLAAQQTAELVVSHIDCNTIPFLWQYADRFAMFDAFHQTVTGPSTPNAIALIAGQSGLTQWALHQSEASSNTKNPQVKESGGEPVVADPGPFSGSNLDTVPNKPPYSPDDESPATPALDQTYASLPLSFMGKNIKQIVAQDENPNLDLADVQADIAEIAGDNLPPTNWAWYELGYANEPTDPHNTKLGPNTDYIVHHEGPQYFGYVADNVQERTQHLFGQSSFYSDVANGNLSPTGGVYYVRGGYGNLDGLTPADPNTTVRGDFAGNDDHPGYSDAQISEASVADTVNAIASSKYWANSAIIVTYDETDGLYDHQQLKVRALDPEGNPVEGGPRIPAIVISPFASAHAIIKQYSEHSSVIKFIDELYGLTPLADLPNEIYGRLLGYLQLGQTYLTPADDIVPGIGDLFPAFDNARLLGTAEPIPASQAMIDPITVHSLPHYAAQGGGCAAIGVTPTDFNADGTVKDPAPADFNPRPTVTPGIPTQPGWTP